MLMKAVDWTELYSIPYDSNKDSAYWTGLDCNGVLDESAMEREEHRHLRVGNSTELLTPMRWRRFVAEIWFRWRMIRIRLCRTTVSFNTEIESTLFNEYECSEWAINEDSNEN